MNDTALVKLDAARYALAECKTAMEAKSISDVAEAARVYLERTNASAETVNRATEIRLLAERQMGAFLKEMPKAGPQHSTGGGSKGSSREPLPDAPPTLAEIGISKKQSATAQKLADIPSQEFHERIAVIKAGGEKLTTSKIFDNEIKMPTTRVYEQTEESTEVLARAEKEGWVVTQFRRLWKKATKAEKDAIRELIQ